jgi:HK97 family phage portal protein
MNPLRRLGAALDGLRTGVYPKELIENVMLTLGAHNIDPSGSYQRACENVVWVFACVMKRANFAAMVPLKFYRIPPGGSEDDKEPLPYDHPACETWRLANPRQVNYSLKRDIQAYRCLGGSSVILKIDGKDVYTGPPKELWPIRPDRVKKIKMNDDGTIDAFYLGIGEGKWVPAKQIIYIPDFAPYHDVMGMSKIKPLERTIVSEIEAQNYNIGMMRNMGVPGALFTGKVPKDAGKRQAFLAMWDKIHGGGLKAGRSGILPEGIKMLLQGVPIKDMMYGELRKMNRQEIFGDLGTNDAVMGLEVADRSRAEAMRRQFAEDTMVPELTCDAQHFNEFWLNEYPDSGRIICEHDYSKVPALKEDEVAKADIAVKVVNAGVLSREEARKIYYKLPAEPEEGTLLVPLTMVPYGTERAPVDDAARSRSELIHTTAETRRLEVYARRVGQGEKQIQRWMTEMFTAQEAEATRLLSEGRGKRDIEDLFGPEYAGFLNESTRKYLERAIHLAMETGRDHALEALPAGFDFSLKNPALQKWAREQSFEHVKKINDFTVERLRSARDALAADIAEGKPLGQVAKHIQKAFDISPGRAARIARTEMVQGVQKTQSIAWKESGVVTEHEWLSSGHPEGRHNEIDHQRVPLGSLFTLPSGVQAEAPGLSGDPAEDINCLCDRIAIVSAQASKLDVMARDLEKKLYPVEKAGRGSKEWHRKSEISRLIGAR